VVEGSDLVKLYLYWKKLHELILTIFVPKLRMNNGSDFRIALDIYNPVRKSAKITFP